MWSIKGQFSCAINLFKVVKVTTKKHAGKEKVLPQVNGVSILYLTDLLLCLYGMKYVS